MVEHIETSTVSKIHKVEIAIFFGNILREERNSVFPHFSPKKSVFSGHEWLQFEYRAKRDILEAISELEYTDFARGNGGKMVQVSFACPKTYDSNL